MIGQLNSLLPPIRPHTSLFYRQTFHWHFLSSSLHFSPTSQRDREREREEREELEHNQHLLLLLLLALSRLPFFQHTLALLPSDADWMQTGGFPAASWVSAPFLPSSLYPPPFPFPPPPLFSNIWSFSSSASSLLPLPHHQDVALSGSAPLWILCFDPRWACLHVSLCLSFTLFSGNRIAAAF